MMLGEPPRSGHPVFKDIATAAKFCHSSGRVLAQDDHTQRLLAWFMCSYIEEDHALVSISDLKLAAEALKV